MVRDVNQDFILWLVFAFFSFQILFPSFSADFSHSNYSTFTAANFILKYTYRLQRNQPTERD